MSKGTGITITNGNFEGYKGKVNRKNNNRKQIVEGYTMVVMMHLPRTLSSAGKAPNKLQHLTKRQGEQFIPLSNSSEYSDILQGVFPVYVSSR